MKPKPRVLLIGWDAADWKVIQPLLSGGQMPNLARLIADGVSGNVATIYPVLSPMLWTSIATGKRAYKHGVHGFAEPLPDGSAIRPISLLSRKTKAVWNILNQNNQRSIVVGWWPSHPAEPLNGVMVSNQYPLFTGQTAEQALPAGTIHPAALAAGLRDLRVDPMELNGEFLRLFVPEFDKVDQDRDKRLHALARITAETMSVHAVATELLATHSWDFAAVYYNAIDHFGHAFMRYHPPRLPWVGEEDFAIYQGVMANAYRYHDAMLGTLLNLAGDQTTVILMSDHGFHPDHLRPQYIPAEPAGPAVEHRHFGILCLKGPGLKSGEKIFGASLLDLCPTILTLFGLPPGRDMDGKVLSTAFRESPVIEPIGSWDEVAGDAGVHPSETRLDPVASAEAFKQLVELGYVAPPGDKVEEAVAECVRELKYNLARAYRDGNCCGEAAFLAEELWTRWPKEHRFAVLLADCLAPLREVARRRAVIDELGRRIEKYQAEAIAELAKRKEAPKSATSDDATAEAANKRRQFEERQLRELAHGRPLLIQWLRVSQAILEENPVEARHTLQALAASGDNNDALNQRIAGALAQLGDLEAARELLEAALRVDPENSVVLGHLATVQFKSGRFDEAIAAATDSLSLVYHQPALHALLGQALLEIGRYADAEKELLVAVAQSPRHLAAHDLLGRLYREHLARPADAFAHEGRARSLRNELAARARTGPPAGEDKAEPSSGETSSAPDRLAGIPEAFSDTFDATQTITVVSGLPRSGTSMMMQLLTAGGRTALADSQRPADEDNPLGYFEFGQATGSARDVSWVPLARGKVVKVVAQLLPFLPRNEHYDVILMERDLNEVIASQNAMLTRQGRRGAELNENQLREVYSAQLARVRAHLARRAEVRTLTVNYAELLDETDAGVERLARFLGEPFNRAAAAAAIHPELRRQKA